MELDRLLLREFLEFLESFDKEFIQRNDCLGIEYLRNQS